VRLAVVECPETATIDWYNKNNGGRIPNSDGLLSASLPGVIDARYIMLDRWGTMPFAQVLGRAIDVMAGGNAEEAGGQ
jgi:gamma-glutamyltranspeptidase